MRLPGPDIDSDEAARADSRGAADEGEVVNGNVRKVRAAITAIVL